MTEQQKQNAKIISEYLINNYHDDGKEMSNIPIIGAMVNYDNSKDIPSMIDKVAIINGIKKSYKPKEIVITA